MKKTGQFLLENDFIDDHPALTKSGLQVYLALRRMSRKERCFPSVRTLARKLRLHERSVQRGMQELQGKRLIHIRERAGRSNVYELVCDSPVQKCFEFCTTPGNSVTPTPGNSVTPTPGNSVTPTTLKGFKEPKGGTATSQIPRILPQAASDSRLTAEREWDLVMVYLEQPERENPQPPKLSAVGEIALRAQGGYRALYECWRKTPAAIEWRRKTWLESYQSHMLLRQEACV